MNIENFNHQRVQKNLQALAELKSKKPNPAVLKQYTGWGGLRNAIFTPNVYKELKGYVSNQDLISIKKTLTNAYYTPQELIKFIYQALSLLKRSFERILEPSAGHGLFFEFMPEEFSQAKLCAVEMDRISCRLMECLYPNVELFCGGFETCNLETTFDLIIGNPPYGRETLIDEHHMDLSNLRIHHYFVAKCMRLLAPGGVLAMVLPRYFLDNRRDHARELIHQEGGSLLAAYRLPDNLFADAKVTVDVVFLIKEKRSDDWLYFDKLQLQGETTYINRYFSANPSHVIGELGLVEAYGRNELTCSQSKEYDTLDRLSQQLSSFPPQQLPTIRECKELLLKRLELIDKQIHSLSLTKKQLMNTQSELHLMEKQFMRAFANKASFDISLN